MEGGGGKNLQSSFASRSPGASVKWFPGMGCSFRWRDRKYQNSPLSLAYMASGHGRSRDILSYTVSLASLTPGKDIDSQQTKGHFYLLAKK